MSVDPSFFFYSEEGLPLTSDDKDLPHVVTQTPSKVRRTQVVKQAVSGAFSRLRKKKPKDEHSQRFRTPSNVESMVCERASHHSDSHQEPIPKVQRLRTASKLFASRRLSQLALPKKVKSSKKGATSRDTQSFGRTKVMFPRKFKLSSSSSISKQMSARTGSMDEIHFREKVGEKNLETRKANLVSMSHDLDFDNFNADDERDEFQHENITFHENEDQTVTSSENQSARGTLISLPAIVRRKPMSRKKFKENLEILKKFYQQYNSSRSNLEAHCSHLLTQYSLGHIAMALEAKYGVYPEEFFEEYMMLKAELSEV